MSSAFKSILIVGGTSGIGEAFARRWHAQGKKLILTGRRQERLAELEKSLPGTRSYAFDITDLKAIPGHVDALFKQFSDIDTVWINSGQGNKWDVKDPASFSDEQFITETTTNVMGPIIFARNLIPHLLAKKSTTNLLATTSGLAYVPNPNFPTYPATKAYLHHFLVSTRGSLKDTNVNVIEIVPPMVSTDFHQQYHEVSKKLPSLSLDEFTNEIFDQLDSSKAEDLKEVAAGSAKVRAGLWRGAMGKYMTDNNLPG